MEIPVGPNVACRIRPARLGSPARQQAPSIATPQKVTKARAKSSGPTVDPELNDELPDRKRQRDNRKAVRPYDFLAI